MKEEFESYLSYFGLTVEELLFPLLDVGAGDGGFVQYCKEVLGHDDAVGLDISTEKIPHTDAVLMGDATNMPLRTTRLRWLFPGICYRHLLLMKTRWKRW